MASKKDPSKPQLLIEAFKERVSFYQKELSLLTWCIDILPQIKEGTNASTYFHDGEFGKANRRCTISYSLGFVNDPETSLENVDKAVFHEVCEVLLANLRHSAESGRGAVVVDQQVHEVIRVLENTLWKSFQRRSK